jgi:hypothetical protein
MMDRSENQVSELEIDLLLLLYTFSDQHGHVDVKSCQTWAKEKLGVLIKDKPFKITQKHVDILARYGAVPDIAPIIHRMKVPPPPEK